MADDDAVPLILTITLSLLLAALLWMMLRCASQDTSRSAGIDDFSMKEADTEELPGKPLWHPIEGTAGMRGCDVLATSDFVDHVLSFLTASERWRAAAVSHVWYEASRGGIAGVSALVGDVSQLSNCLASRQATGLELLGRSCKLLSAEGLVALLQRLPPTVRVLRLARCSAVSDETINSTSLGGFAHALTVLDLSLTKASDDALEALLNGPSGRSLEWLCLSHSKVGDVGVCCLASRCRALEHLDLSYLERLAYLADDFGTLLRTSRRTLISLDLSGLAFVDDDHIEIVVSTLSRLQTFKLFGCRRVTAGGIRLLLGRAACLRSLDLGHQSALVADMAESQLLLEAPQACRLAELSLVQSIKPPPLNLRLGRGPGPAGAPSTPPPPSHSLLVQLAASPHAATLTVLDLRATPLALDHAELAAFGRLAALRRLELEGSLHLASEAGIERLEALLPSACELVRKRAREARVLLPAKH